MFVNFFIDRPVFSTVIALVIVVAGLVSIPVLPVAQFPQITPPVVQVQAVYTGASAEVVEKTVTSPLEEQINGVEGMTYMSSSSSNDGTSIINVTFEIGYDLDTAAVDVQNRVDVALPRLPEDVRRYGVTTKKKSTDFILIVTLLSPENTYKNLFLSNYADINLVDALKRINGVGDVQILGERKYAMRFWLDPDKLASLGLTAMDVVSVVQDQNIQVAAGAIGNPPSPKDQVFQYTISTKGRLTDIEEFENIIIKTDAQGAITYMKDVATVELGAESYNWYTTLNGKNCASIGIYQLPGANSVEVANEVRATMLNLSKGFPDDLAYTIPYDTTVFVKESIKEVVHTLFIAILLVFLVIFIFLQDWRSTMVPAVVIPVSLVGTFGIMMAFGFSINTLTLFGLVLAIGLVVDDSIVVVENASRVIEQEGLSPKEATKKSMSEVVGPIIATTLILGAVFVPVAFIPGISGQLYKQFALTIVFSVFISAINALSLSPAMCALILRKKDKSHGRFFTKFNQGLSWFTKKYEQGVKIFIDKWKLVIAGFAVLLGVTYLIFSYLPTGFVPDEDQGYFFMVSQGSEGTALNRTRVVSDKIEKIAGAQNGVESVLTIGGYNLLNASLDSSSTSYIVILKPWADRQTKELSLNSIIGDLQVKTQEVTDVLTFLFNPPPIMGLSTTGGFQYELQDKTGGSLVNLNQVAQQVIAEAKKHKALSSLSETFKVNYPQYYIDLDRTKAKTLGVSISDVFNTLQAYLGSLYVNDFNKFGRVYRVYAQAKKDFRSEARDISRFYVRSGADDLIPLSALVKIKQIRGVQTIKHYNIFRTIEINGASAPGYSSGQAIKAMENVSAKILPENYGFEWTGVAYQEIKAGSMAVLIFGLAIVFVYLFLAAQYESWIMPIMVLLAVPLAILGALSAQLLRGLVNDVYCQIGLVMLIGLASKNAILIVEFAKTKHQEGLSIVEAALAAARIRLRPILMTAFSFILGVIPLVIASGAGAASRHSLGTTVFGGMIASTFLSLVLVPVLFVVLETLRERGLKKDDPVKIIRALVVGLQFSIQKIELAFAKVKHFVRN